MNRPTVRVRLSQVSNIDGSLNAGGAHDAIVTTKAASRTSDALGGMQSDGLYFGHLCADGGAVSLSSVVERLFLGMFFEQLREDVAFLYVMVAL